MSQWYISKKGQATGPISEEEVLAKIDEGSVSHLDLVYCAGESDWRPVAEVPEFAERLGVKMPSAQIQEPVEWVLLKKVTSENGKEYRQLGPFSESQVLNLVDQGEIRFADFCWKKGMEAWVKIAELPEFNLPLPSTPEIDTSLYLKEQSESASNSDVDEVTPPSAESIEAFVHPQGAEGDLSENEIQHDVIAEETLTESEILVGGALDDDRGDDLSALTVPSEKVIENESSEKLKGKKKPSKTNKEKKRKQKKSSTQKEPTRGGFDFDSGVLPWAAAVTVLVAAIIFLFLSVSSKDESSEVASDTETVRFESDPPVGLGHSVEQALVVDEEPPPLETVAVVPDVLPPHPRKKPSVAIAVKKSKVKVAKKVETKLIEDRVARIPTPKKPDASKRKQALSRRKVAKARGSVKARSFYLQRDRKALFYSSLKAKTLVVDIDRTYKKLRKNKGAWKKYYSQWKKKVRLSLAKEIRAYPERNQKYGYPTQLASFKKDYNRIYKYGEVFNSKVYGKRRPSGAPKNLVSTFNRYNRQAKSLGR